MWDDQTFKAPFEISRRVDASEIQDIIGTQGHGRPQAQTTGYPRGS